MKLLFTICGFFFLGIVLSQQEFKSEGFEIKGLVDAGMIFNHKDFYFEIGGGIQESKSKFSATLCFAFRPFYKKVQIITAPFIIHQYKEKKLLIALNIDKRIFDFPIGKSTGNLMIGCKNGYLFGSYKGTEKGPKSGYSFAPFLGLSAENYHVRFKLAYLFFNDRISTVPNSKLMLGLSIPL